MLILVVGEASNPRPPSLNPFDQEDDVWQFEREEHFEEEIDRSHFEDCMGEGEGDDLVPPLGNNSVDQCNGFLSFERNGRPMFDFILASKFKGARRGFVFKLGSKGIGYYADTGQANSATLANSGTQIIDGRTCTAEQSGDEPLGQWPQYVSKHDVSLLDPCASSGSRATVLPLWELLFNDAFALEGKRRRLKRKRPKRKKRGKGGEWDKELKCPSHVEAFSKWHEEHSLWAVDTLNPNSLNGLKVYLDSSSASVVLAQEGREDDPESLVKHECVARRAGWNLANFSAFRTDLGGLSSGVAIASRSFYGMTKNQCIDLPSQFASRIGCAHVGAFCKGGVHVVSVYFWNSEGLSQRNVELMHHVAALLSSLNGPWVLGADFNMCPEVVQSSGWLSLIKGKIIAPDAPTCGSGLMIISSLIVG